MNFKQIFFRIYDRKIASGEITFSKSGIKKDDFTRLCTEEGFVLSREAINLIAVNMKLTEEEKSQLLEAAGKEGMR